MKTNEDIPILSATTIFARDSKLVYDLCGYSLGFSCEEALIDCAVVESGRFSMPSVAISSEPLNKS